MMVQGGIYLFIGPDRARKRERIDTIAKTLAVQLLDRHTLQAQDLTAPALLTLARSHPAASPLRLIVVDEAEQLDSTCVRAVAKHAQVLARTAYVILLVEDDEIDAEHPLAPLKACATEETFESSERRTSTSFALVEAIAKRNTAEALQALQEQLAAGEEELRLLGFLAWQLQQWLTVAHLVAAKVSRDAIEQMIGIRPWQLERIQRALGGRSVASLRQGLEACWELDVAAKRGRVSLLRLALEQLIVQLCLPPSAQIGTARAALRNA